jgi:DNA (cytosine-5)-methyltransferase 1
VQCVAFDTTQMTSAANRSNPKVGDPCHPLAAGAHAPAIAFDCKSSGQNGFGVSEEVASTLRAMGHAGSHQNGGGHQAVAFDSRMRGAEPAVGREERPPQAMVERTGAIDATKPWNVATNMQVRRLTPRECCRLQGFEDTYLDILFRGKPAADGPKYKALGNSWAVPNVRWIGQRIDAVDAITRNRRTA